MWGKLKDTVHINYPPSVQEKQNNAWRDQAFHHKSSFWHCKIFSANRCLALFYKTS